MSATSAHDLSMLAALSTPAVANAIDALDLRPKTGFATDPSIICQFREMASVVGYAATLTVSADHADETGAAPHRHRYWEYLESLPKPIIVVVHDADDRKGQGAFLGEVNGTIHRGLGCIAAVTDGGYRDVPELRALGLQVFAPFTVTSAGYMHIVDFGRPVRVGGLLVRPGDILHGDRHGLISVPPEAVDRIPDTAAAVRQKELEIVDLYASGRFSLDQLKRLRPR